MRDLFGEELPDRSSRPCRACGAPLVWGKTTKGKAIPLDAAPSPCGNVNLRSDGTAEVLGPATAQTVRLGGVALYLSHFATCPKAATFRKPKPATGEASTCAAVDGAKAGPSGPPPEPSTLCPTQPINAPPSCGENPAPPRIESAPSPPISVAISDGSQDVDGFAPLEGLLLPPGFRAWLPAGWTQPGPIAACEACKRGCVTVAPDNRPMHIGCAEVR